MTTTDKQPQIINVLAHEIGDQNLIQGRFGMGFPNGWSRTRADA